MSSLPIATRINRLALTRPSSDWLHQIDVPDPETSSPSEVTRRTVPVPAPIEPDQVGLGDQVVGVLVVLRHRDVEAHVVKNRRRLQQGPLPVVERDL